MDSELQSLNETYNVPGQVRFEAGPGGLVQAVIENEYASAQLTLMGANVLSYTPRGHQPVLWTAPNEVYQLGKALHSGVPVCWPWFGAHPSQPDLPMHGLVRTRLWSLRGAQALPDGATEVRLAIQDSPETLAIWPHRFAFELTVTVGRVLKIDWRATNPGQDPYSYTGALHPYFAVSNIRDVRVLGLEDCDYLDKTEDFARHHQEGPVTFEGSTDRVYLDTTADLTIQDPGLAREIRIRKTGSHTSVVWNPAEHDAHIAAIGPGGHTSFVCVEAANAFDDMVWVAPGGEGRLGMEIEAVPAGGGIFL